MLKLKKTAKETAAELKNHGYRVEWKIATRTYTATDNYASVTIYAKYETAEADSIQKENELVAAFPGFFAYIEAVIEEANQEIAADAPESAQDSIKVSSEGKETTGSENASESATDGYSGEELTSEEMSGLTVSLPMDGFTVEAIGNLRKLVDAKANLIRKAMDTDRLDIVMGDGKVSFPWWDRLPTPEETQAYIAFIAAICAFAKQARRVNATERPGEVESEKYAFRGFLLRLGFIGPECAAQRKLLLHRLSGAASFPSAEKYTAFCSTQKAKRDAAKEVSE